MKLEIKLQAYPLLLIESYEKVWLICCLRNQLITVYPISWTAFEESVDIQSADLSVYQTEL